MKWFKRILLSILIAIPAIILLIYLLLWMPPIQSKIKDIALKEVIKKTGNTMKIKTIAFHPFNKLILEEVYVADLKGDTLLYVGKLNAGFDLLQLLNDRLLIKSVELDNVVANISRDSLNAPFNFQFFIDAFASKDTTTTKEPSKMVIEIDNVNIKNGNIRYNIASIDTLGRGIFDSNHIHLTNLDLEVQLKSIDPEKLNVNLKNLKFKEQSGFELTKLEAKLKSKDGKMDLEDLSMQLPHSDLQLKSVKLDYSKGGINNIINSASYYLDLKESVIFPEDLKAFSPTLENFKDSLFLSGKIEGQFPEINLTKLQASIKETAELDISARIADFNNWKTSAIEVSVNKLYISNKIIKETKIIPQNASLTTGDINLSGKINGSLPDMNIDLKASSDLAKLSVNGMAGYIYDTKKIRADIKLNVERFRYNGYTYKNVTAHGKYLNDSIKLDLKSKDKNVPLELMISGNLHPARESIRLTANINHLRLDTTNWLPSHPGADLYGRLSVNVKGFDPEKMKASLTLDSLIFKTSNDTILEKQMKIDYLAEIKSSKNLTVTSDLLDMTLKGNFMLKSIANSFQQTLSKYLPSVLPQSKKIQESNDQLSFNVNIKNFETLEKAFKLPIAIPGTASMKGLYNAERSSIALQADVPNLIYGNKHFSATSINFKTDSIRHKINMEASTQSFEAGVDSLMAKLKLETIEKGVSLVVDFRDKTPKMNVTGQVMADIHLEFDKKNQLENVNVNLLPGEFIVNAEHFKLSASQISLLLKEQKYAIRDFSLSHSEAEFIKIDGNVSKNASDSLNLNIGNIQLKTLADILKLNMDLQGEADGEIILKDLLTTPLVFTKGFSIKNISLEGNNVGTLNLVSGWSKENQGLKFKADLIRENMPNSTVEGQIFPQKDLIQANVDINSIPLALISPFTTGTLFGLQGELGTRIKITGSMKAPELDGIFYLNNANIGVSMLNTQYKISDTIHIAPNQIKIENLQIIDENKKSALLSGSIKHKHFTDFTPDLNLDFNNFLVLNNAQYTDSLFYGNLRISGDVKVTSKDKNILVDARLSNSDNSVIMVTIPESASEAQRYSSITFINTGEDSIQTQIKNKTETSMSLPVKLNISLSVTPGLKLGAIINPQTKDAATVTGSGTIDFSYDMSNSKMALYGGYTIKEGNCTLSLKNITKKSFTIREGGKLTFKGDPMATAFDVSAVYTTRTDMKSLDENFESIMTTTKILVNAVLTVSGDLNKMNLKYDIEYPGERDEIKRKADGLMYTDDIKIREFAYLLAFNTFFRVNSSESRSMGTDLWTSLASSTITSQLNNLLSGVLNENWSIGTELHANDKNLSDVEMDVNVSTRLFDDRLTVNSNIGYKNTSTSTNDNNNFTGDFDIQLKLTKSGNVVLKVYDVTNNKYFDTAKRTQGVGIMYRKEARTFKSLFRKIKSIIKK